MEKIRLLTGEKAQREQNMCQIDIVLATNRPLVRTLFHGLADEQSQYTSLDVKSTTLPVTTLDRHLFENVSLIVMDTMPDIEAAIQACELLQSQHIPVPIVGLFCCPRHVELRQWRALAAVGIHTMIDMSAATQNIYSILETAAQGGFSISLQFQDNQGASLKDVIETTIAKSYSLRDQGLSENDELLLGLVSRGTTDQEIGAHLCLSPHTVKHRIERLRNQIGVGSRIELAAWAGYHGFYTVAAAG